jgi:hypothetical protein
LSREDLVDSYVHGRISRRLFVRGLVALGVSAGAAATYADSLSAAAAPRAASPAAATDDYYPQEPTSSTSTTTTVAGGAAEVGAGEAGVSGAAGAVQSRPRFTG